jgi:hypothetical protein
MNDNSQSAAKDTKSFPIALVLPCLESRTTIKETLCSLEESSDLFDEIIISVNGLSPRLVHTVLASLSLRPRNSLQVICTENNLTAVDHAKFIMRRLRVFVAAQAWLFFLADDDLLAPRSSIKKYLCSFRSSDLNHVGMGHFLSFSQEQPKKVWEKQHLEPGEAISPSEFLQRNQSGFLFTNISSMIVPHVVARDCLFFMSFWGSAGRRTEYIWATHRLIKMLQCPSAATAFIRQHPSQEGRTLSHDSGVHDELIYIAWVWLNQPSFLPWGQNGQAPDFTLSRFLNLYKSLIKSQLRSVPLLIRIVRALRSFRF